MQEKIIFAGGCFWCIETPFKYLKGVVSAIPGYTGGSQPNPSYGQVAHGNTGHREAVEVTYDPSLVTFEELLKVFWLQIDPIDPGGQFADRGYEYTTAIYYFSDQQKDLAERSKKTLSDSKKHESPIVTEILPAQQFYPAEEYHHDFAQKNPERYKQYHRLSGREAFVKLNQQK